MRIGMSVLLMGPLHTQPAEQGPVGVRPLHTRTGVGLLTDQLQPQMAHKSPDALPDRSMPFLLNVPGLQPQAKERGMGYGLSISSIQSMLNAISPRGAE